MNEKIAHIKKHVNNHKKAYIIAGSVVGVGAVAAGSYILGTKSVAQNVETWVAPKNTINGVAWKPIQTIEVTVEALGDPGNIIQDLTTGTIYASQSQAAKALGVSRAAISRSVNGLSELSNGHKLVNLGKAHVMTAAEAV